MTNLSETPEEPVANPYNMNKGYDIEDEEPFESADGVYYEKKHSKKAKKKATRKTPSDEAESTDYKKRYDDLKKHYDTKINEFKQKEEELVAEARMTQQVQQTVAHEDKVEAQSEYAVEEPQQAVSTSSPTLDNREKKVARKEAEESLRDAHPDFGDIRASEEFHAWAKSQPDAIQDWVYNNPNNVGLAIKAIDLFKAETGSGVQSGNKSGKSQPSSRGSAADMVSTKTKTIDAGEPKIWTQREIAALSMEDYDRYEQEIDLALTEGRVVG